MTKTKKVNFQDRVKSSYSWFKTKVKRKHNDQVVEEVDNSSKLEERLIEEQEETIIGQEEIV